MLHTPTCWGLPTMFDDVPWLGAVSLHSLPPSSLSSLPLRFHKAQIESLGQRGDALLSMCPFLLFFLKLIYSYILYLAALGPHYSGFSHCTSSQCAIFRSCDAQDWLPCGVWGLSSLTGDRTCVPCIGRGILNHWTPKDSPLLFL